MGKKKDYRVLLKTPFDTGIRSFPNVAKYFLYYAPSIDSAQSPGEIVDGRATALLNEMLKRADMGNSARFLKRIQPSSWKKDDLEETELDFDRPRMLCDKYGSENELHSLLRHIRNALAHGYIYVWKKKDWNRILLVDFDSNKRKVTAKILVSMAILEQWKATLENEIPN